MRNTLSVDEFRARVARLFAEQRAELDRTQRLVARLSRRTTEDEIDDLCDPERHLFL